MTQIEGNPARALHNVLQRLSSAIEAGPSGPLRESWAKAFAVGGDSPDMGRSMAAVSTLAAETRVAVEAHDPSLSADIRHVEDRLAEGLVLGTRAPKQDYWARIEGDATLRVLRISASLLDNVSVPRTQITDVEVLVQRLGELIADLRSSDLPGDLAASIIEKLEQVVAECHKAPMTSGVAVTNIVAGLAGYLLGDHSLAEVLKKSKAGLAVLGFVVAFHLWGPSQPQELPPPDDVTVQVVVVTGGAGTTAAPDALHAGPPAPLELEAVSNSATD